MILVLGGGFGLYGHVAALASVGAPVATLSRYREVAEARPELAPLVDRIEWVDDERDALRRASTVVVARRPAENAALARHLADIDQKKALVIEKPIAASPSEAAELHAFLCARGQRYAVPYTLLQCEWFSALAVQISKGASARLRWSHLQSAQVHPWKNAPDQGGGQLGYYFIHCLAMIEALMPGAAVEREIIPDRASDETISVVAKNGQSRLSCQFTLSLSEAPQFIVDVAGKTLIKSATPFGPTTAPRRPDARLGVLQRFYRDIATTPDFQPPAFHAAVIRQWADLSSSIRLRRSHALP